MPNDDVIIWLNLAAENLTTPEISDYAERNLVDRFSALDGVARVRVGGSRNYALRVWIDRRALAARNLTVNLDSNHRLARADADLIRDACELGGIQGRYPVLRRTT